MKETIEAFKIRINKYNRSHGLETNETLATGGINGQPTRRVKSKRTNGKDTNRRRSFRRVRNKKTTTN